MAGNNALVGGKHRDGEQIQVRVARLDEVLSLSGRRICIKIDVEGHESATLRGAERTLRENICFLQVECLGPAATATASEIVEGFGLQHLFRLNNDHLFISPELIVHQKRLLDTISAQLAGDLHDLTHLRAEKRMLAAQAKKLWQAAGYDKDPVLG